MKQVYAVGTPPATAGTAPTVRAVSPGVESADLDGILPYLGYAPPPGRVPDAADPLPTRLALLNLGHAGRVLAHVVPDGDDDRTGYFAHAVLDVPPSADAHLVIQTWGSPGWEHADPQASAEIPDLPYLPVADVLDDDAVKDWLSTPVRRELLEFVLTALLTTDGGTRIFVAASAEDVARVVFAITRALPPSMLDDFSFSTYEPDPLTSVARLTGHDTGSAEWDLPDLCYSGAGVAFHPGTGRRSLLPAEAEFAAFATAALASGEFGPLDEFKATWQRLGMSGVGQFDLVFRLARGTGVLTKEETTEALQYPPLTAWVSARTDALNQFLEWAMEDRGFAQASFSRVAQALRQKPDLLAKLGQTVREQGMAALKAGDRVRTANALEVTLPMVAPAKANAVWGELIAQVTDPDAIPWDMRWYLLPKFVKFKQQQAGRAGGAETKTPDAALVKWLDVPADRLGEALALDVPKAYHVAAGRACLARDGEPSAEFVQTLTGHPGLTLTLLRPETPGAETDRQVQLFEGLLADAPGYPWFEQLLTLASDYPPALLNTYFESTLATGKADPDRLVRTSGPRLMELFTGQSGLDRLGQMYLVSPPADVLQNPNLIGFLRQLREEPKVSAGVKERAGAVLAVREYLDAPSFDPEAMAPVAAAMAVTPPAVPPSAKGELFTLVGDELLRRADDPNLQTELESALLNFGPTLAADPVDLYENLLRDLRGRADLTRNVNFVTAFLAVALGANKSPELTGKLDGLDVHAFALASDAARRGGNRMLAEIDRRSADWPKSAQTQWGFLSKAVRPRGFAGLMKDVGLVVLGAALASAVWGGLRLAGI